MKVFVLRRGESQPVGPLTDAEVAEMRIHWEVSDADYFRAENSERWRLVGELVPDTVSRTRFSPPMRWMAAAVVVAAAFISFLATRPVADPVTEISLAAHAPEDLHPATETAPDATGTAPADGNLESPTPTDDSPPDIST